MKELIEKEDVLLHDIWMNFGDAVVVIDIPYQPAAFVLVIVNLNWLDYVVEVKVTKDGYLIKKSKTDKIFFKDEGDVIEWIDSVLEDW